MPEPCPNGDFIRRRGLVRLLCAAHAIHVSGVLVEVGIVSGGGSGCKCDRLERPRGGGPEALFVLLHGQRTRQKVPCNRDFRGFRRLQAESDRAIGLRLGGPDLLHSR